MICVTWHLDGHPRAQVLRWMGRAETSEEAVAQSKDAIETIWDAIRSAAGKPFDSMPDDLAHARPIYRKATLEEQYAHGDSDVAWRVGKTLRDHGFKAVGRLPPRWPTFDVQEIADALVLSDFRVDVRGRAAEQAEPAAVVMTHAYDRDLVTFDTGSGGIRTGPHTQGPAIHRTFPPEERVAPQAATVEALMGLAALLWAMQGCPTARGGVIIARAKTPQSATLAAGRSRDGAAARRTEGTAAADRLRAIGLTSAATRFEKQAKEQERC